MMGAPEGLTESGSGEAGNPKLILTNIISLLLGEPSDQGLFIHCFVLSRLNMGLVARKPVFGSLTSN